MVRRAKFIIIHHAEGHLAIDKRVQSVGSAVAGAVADDARKMAPKDTGMLASSIVALRVTTYAWHVQVGTDHWHQMEYGVKPHGPIYPRGKKALYWGGLPHPVAHVKMHPGNKAEPFMRPATLQPRALVVMPSGTVVVSKSVK